MMTLYSGKRVDLLNVKPDDMDIEDIAHSLSMICRFSGHTNRFYSVAQHSVRVCNVVEPALQLTGLLHDATEAIVGDMIRPLKQLLPSYRTIEERVWKAVATRYRLPLELPPTVDLADKMALKSELLQFMEGEAELSDPYWENILALPPVYQPWSPHEAKLEFMLAFKRASLSHKAF